MRRLPCPPSLLRLFPFRMALLLACLVVFALPGRAQTGVYAEFSTSNLQTPNVGQQYGPTFGLYHEIFHPPFFRVGLDARATLLGSGSTKVDMGLIGPQLQIHPRVLPLMPYVEGLVGVGYVHLGQGFATVDETKLDYAGVIGVDWTILPRIDWRVVEFSSGGFAGLGTNVTPKTWSTGLVLRLP